MSEIVLKLNKVTLDLFKASAPAVTPPANQPANFKLISGKTNLLDQVVAFAFLLCVSGIVWLIWDQQRLLQ